MYPHVGPCTPYFDFGYGGIKSVPTMWPPISDPLINLIAPPKLVMGIAQAGIVTNCKELSNQNKDFKKKTQHQDATNRSFQKIVQ